jgi:hypothetical protein
LDLQDKDTQSLSKRQKKVAELLMTGKFSAADISVALHFSDPRGHIRNLRNKGINVADEWIKSEDVRFKRYWITSENEPEVSDAKSVGEILEENFPYLLNLYKLKNYGKK